MNYFIIVFLYVILLIKSINSQITVDDINDLRVELREEFDASGRFKDLLPTTVRLAFHDCAGPQELNGNAVSRCNGCINYNNSDHSGLVDGAINTLDIIYTQSNWNEKMSRADFWAAAATIAVEYSIELDINSNDTIQSIPYYFGRTDCGDTSQATQTKIFPHATSGWTETFEWFRINLGFDIRETIAIIGAHTLGRAHSQFSGYSSLPWVAFSDGPELLNNQFYKNILNNNWIQSLSSANKWEFKDEGTSSILMFNSDMGLAYHFDDDINITTGEISCIIQIDNVDVRGICPDNEETIDITREYADSNQIWLNDFTDVWVKLVTTGYNVDDDLVSILAPLNLTVPLGTSITSTIGDIDTIKDTVEVEEDEFDGGVLNEYVGVFALIAAVGVVIILIIIVFYCICRVCCGKGKEKERYKQVNTGAEV